MTTACLGICCPKRGICVHFDEVELPEQPPARDSCLSDGGYPLFVDLRPTSFQLHDERGRIWPPGFVSQLLDINSPHTILRTAQYGQEAAKKRAATKAKKPSVWGVPA